jgi:hypothetical protein
MMLRTSLLTPIVSLALAGCGTSGEPRADGNGSAVAAKGGVPGKAGVSGQAASAHGGASLSQGKFTVLGLRIPDGMHPATGVLGFYRYVGIFPVEQVAGFVRAQLSDFQEEREGRARLFRQALVKRPAGGGESTRRLAVRVSKASGGGALLDVWIEEKPTGDRAAGGSAGPSAAPLPMTQAEREERDRMKAETRRVMEKVSRHEKLTPEDLKSQFFE